MNKYYLIKNTEDDTYFRLDNINKKKDHADIEFSEYGKAMPLNDAQANQVFDQLSKSFPKIKFDKIEIDESVAGMLMNPFDAEKILNKEEMKKHNSELRDKHGGQITNMYKELYQANPNFKMISIESAVNNLIHVGLSQISDIDYSGYSKRLEKMLSKDNIKYFNVYSLLIEVGIKSLLKEARKK